MTPSNTSVLQPYHALDAAAKTCVRSSKGVANMLTLIEYTAGAAGLVVIILGAVRLAFFLISEHDITRF